MKRFLGVPLIAVMLLALVASTANAAYWGIGRRCCCECCPTVCCEQQCCTVMKTCREVVFEKRRVHLHQDLLGAGVRSANHQLHEVRARNLLP